MTCPTPYQKCHAKASYVALLAQCAQERSGAERLAARLRALGIALEEAEGRL